MQKALNVLYQSDNNYAPQTGVSIQSLFENNVDIDILDVYVLDDGISPDNAARLRQLGTTWGRRVNIINTGRIKERLIHLGVEPYKGTYTTYFKLLAFSHLGISNSDRILQIDGDTLINESLAPLLDIDMEGKAFFATYDCIQNGYKELVGLSPDSPYYNCGVLLINLKYWQEYDCEQRIIDHLDNVRNRYFTVDQDILNVVFNDEIGYLDIRYNLNSGFYVYGIDNSFWIYDLDPQVFASREEIARAMEHPAINHCMVPMIGRPWEQGNKHPQGPLYDKYLQRSPWKDVQKVSKNPNKLFALQRKLYYLLPIRLYRVIHKSMLKHWLNTQNERCLAQSKKG